MPDEARRISPASSEYLVYGGRKASAISVSSNLHPVKSYCHSDHLIDIMNEQIPSHISSGGRR
jgi:hypothetical protein